MSPCLAVVIFLCSIQLAWVAAYKLTMSPDHVRVSKDPQTVSFSCTAGISLTGCQFRWWNYTDKAGPLLELSRGYQSQANTTHLDTEVTGYTYSGRGLVAGDCGISLQVKGKKELMVGCRVRAENGGWTYAWADMYAAPGVTLPHTLSPRESVVLPGGDVRFTLKAQEPLNRCIFVPLNSLLEFKEGAQSAHSTGRHRYLGVGLGGGECGLAVANVSEADNKPLRAWIENAAQTNADLRFMALIVAHPPSAPILSVVYTDAGVTATCVVHEGRPVAKISWVLGDYVIRQDEYDDTPGTLQDEWRWPWMQGSVLQRLTLRLQPKYNGKVLKCVVSHVTLARLLEATEIISFTGSASDTSCPKDEVYEFRVEEARTAAKTAKLAEEQVKVNLEAAKAEEASKTMLAKLAVEQAKVALEAAKSSAKAEEASKAMLAKVALEVAKAEKDFKAMLARVALEAAKFEEESKAIIAKVGLEAAKSTAKAEEARAREEEAWAKNAEEELQFERERRSPSLQQPQSSQSVQG